MPRWKKKSFFFLLDLDEYTAEMEQRITYQNNILTINLYIIKKKKKTLLKVLNQLNLNKITSLTCSPLLICRGV